MSKNTKIGLIERRKFWDDATSMKNQITCKDKFYDTSVVISGDIVNPDVIPTSKYEIPPYPA